MKCCDNDRSEGLEHELHEAVRIIVMLAAGQRTAAQALDWVFMNFPTLYREKGMEWIKDHRPKSVTVATEPKEETGSNA